MVQHLGVDDERRDVPLYYLAGHFADEAVEILARLGRVGGDVRRQDDVVVRETPLWLVEPPAAVAGRRVLVVDEMCSTGETLRLVRERALALGAAAARTATLYAHTWGADAVDYTGLITDELVLNPWDREIYRDGAFQFHPEYVSALAEQGLVAEPALLIAATPFVAARGS